ncbi:MAG TPA: hypothetical protein VNO22_09425 [Planctomycetota bacterium]|nr:hypothetical protein [Planctomycetota bacterium]
MNAHFVPVYVSNEDYRGPAASAPPEERRLYEDVFRAAARKKLSSGTVHLYILSPEGEPVDSIHVAEARPERVIAALREAAAKFGTPAGPPVVEPRRQAAPPPSGPGDLVLHLVARRAPGASGGFWGELPSEDFVVYSPEEWRRFLPPPGARPGDSWEVPAETALKLLHHFYPSTENNDVSKNKVERVAVRAAWVGPGRVRLDAELRMKHPFYHREDDARVEASAAGLVEFDPSGPSITRFLMATEKASYNGGAFVVAVRSMR